MDVSKLEDYIVSEIKLTRQQAKVYLAVNCGGKMSAAAIAEKLGITPESAAKTADELMDLGAFIDMPDEEFEAMHPRFTAVNMYRRHCERQNVKFARNKLVDSIGTALEKPYEDARTK